MFLTAYDEITKMFKTKDENEGVMGLNEMVKFIMDMKNEGDNRSGRYTCEAFRGEQLNWSKALFAVGELMNPETGIQTSRGYLTFNHHDIEKEGYEMALAFMSNKNWAGFGHILGDTLVKYEGEDPKEFALTFGSEFAKGFLEGAVVG